MADRAFGREGILNADSFTAVLNPREWLAAKQAIKQATLDRLVDYEQPYMPVKPVRMVSTITSHFQCYSIF